MTSQPLDLQTPHLHDFGDLGGGRPNYLLRWTLVIAVLVTVAHFALHMAAPESATSGSALHALNRTPALGSPVSEQVE